MNAELYLGPIRKAVSLFPYAVLIITVPFLIHKYRKYGSLSIHHFLFSYLLVFYLLCVFCLVILPLPDPEEVAQSTRQIFHLQPFSYVADILTQETVSLNSPSTWINLILTTRWLEPLFNVLMLIPFGMYLRYYRRWSLWKTIRFSFYLSLFFELTQLSGLYLIYARPYRMFDINDLIENTLGGSAGWYLAPLFTWFLPKREKTDHAASMNGSVAGFGRRLFAFLLDDIIINIPVLLICSWIGLLVPGLIIALIMTFFLYLNHGVSIGAWVVGLRITDTRTGLPPKFLPLLVRELIVWAWFRYMPTLFLIFGNSSAMYIILAVYILSLLILLTDLIRSRKRDDLQFFFEEKLHIANVPVLKPKRVSQSIPWTSSDRWAIFRTLLSAFLILSVLPYLFPEFAVWAFAGILFCLAGAFLWMRRRRDAMEICMVVPLMLVPYILYNYERLWFILLLIYYIFAVIGAAAGYCFPKQSKTGSASGHK